MNQTLISKSTYSFLHCIIAGLLFIGALGCNKQVEEEPPPNLLIIYPDQHRGQAMGFLGEEPVLTPNLDKFASESLVLTEVISNYPICSPSRASLMTGQYPQQHGVWSNCNTISAPFGYELSETAVTWSDVLNEMGYSLGYIGKWHLDNPREPYINTSNNSGNVKWNEWTSPERRHGFDFWYAYGTYDQHNRPMYWSDTASRENFQYVDEWGPIHETNLAIEYLKNENGNFRDSDKPFALMVSMNPPHMPYDLVPQQYKDLYADKPLEEFMLRPSIPLEGTRWGDYYRKNIKNYFAMISGVDDQFGRIMKVLEEENLTENTIVLYTSDHGNCLGLHDQISKNNHYEESVRIPFIIRWPKEIKPRIDNILLSIPDIQPSLLSLMGFRDKIPKEANGVDYSRLLVHGYGERPDSQLFMSAIPGKTDLGKRGIRTLKYTLMIDKPEDGTTQTVLFDNDADHYQMENISISNPHIVDSLSLELQKWLEYTNDPWLTHFTGDND